MKLGAQILGSLGAVLYLSAPIAMTAQAGTSLQLAQATATQRLQNSIDCRVERSEATLAAVNTQLEQVRQLVNERQITAAAQTLSAAVQAVGRIENLQTKTSLLNGMVNSIPINPSLLEQLVNQANEPTATTQQRQQIAAVLPQVAQVAQSLNTGYSAVKTRTLTSIARYYMTLGQRQQSQATLGQALEASRFLRGADFQAPALIGIAQEYLMISQPEAATPLIAQSLPLAQSIANVNRKAATLEQLTSLYVQTNQLDRAVSVARSIAVPYYQSTATLRIVDHYAGRNQLDRALELLRTVPQADLKSNMLAVFAGRLVSRQPDRAAQLYQEAIATAQTLPSGNQRDQAIADVALRYAEYGPIDTARAAIQALNSPVVKAPALGVIAATYANLNQPDRAEAALTAALSALAAIEDIDNQNFVREQLIEQVLRGGRFDQAARIAGTIQPNEELPFDRVELLTVLAIRAAVGTNTGAALQIVDQIPPSFVEQRDRIFQETARAYARGEDLDRAVQVTQRASSYTAVQPRILAATAAQAQQLGLAQRSSQIFAQAEQTANRLENAAAKAEALAAIAIEYSRIGQPQRSAERVTQAIAATQSISDLYSRYAALRTIAEQLTAANQYQAAIRVAEAIPEPSERAAKLDEAIEKAVSAGDFTPALTAVNRLENPVMKTRWLVTIANRYIQLGQRSPAANLLAQAFQTARTIPGEESRTISVRGGENPLVVDDDQDRGSFLEAIALRYAQIGQVGQALQVAQALQNSASRNALVQRVRCYQSS